MGSTVAASAKAPMKAKYIASRMFTIRASTYCFGSLERKKNAGPP